MDLFEYAHQQQPSEESDLTDAPIFTVSEITSEVKGLITARFGSEGLWIRGEISNFRGRNQSGHMYFRLKDDRSVLNCVFFRNVNRRLDVELKEGLEILARGRLDVWERGGNYQLVIEEVRPAGAGELYLRFEQLKKKLEAEGLFDPARKQPLPEFPHRIGVVTSPTGAVIRDIIHVIRHRCPFVEILLFPVKVQGKGSAEEITRAIEELNALRYRLDLMVIGRGGGSMEDLWAFNEEIVARAIADSKVPVVSAVGHQTDFTIADFVADVRAATPSQAAELAVPNVGEVERRVEMLVHSIVRELMHTRDVASQELKGLLRSPALRDPYTLIQARVQRLDEAIERMAALITTRKDRGLERLARIRDHMHFLLSRTMRPRRLRFEKVVSNLELLSPLAVLSRGYSIVTKPGGPVVKRSTDVQRGDEVSVQLHEGKLACEVTRTSEN